MCGHCGCGDEATTTVHNLQTGAGGAMQRAGSDHDHRHNHDHHHGHDHDPGHSHDHVHAHGIRHQHDHHDHVAVGFETIALEARILAKNDALAARNRAWLSGREILALNLVSSPGAGKTTLLERTIRDLKDRRALYVIEGDQATTRDGERIRAAGAAAVQVNTGSGCHLEADMVARGLQELRPGPGSILMIENVGNLVCPAMFDLGERAKVVILSVAEGDDKPLKYPHMFKAARLMILNKIDLLPYVEFDVARAMEDALMVNPDIVTLRLSARTGEGLEGWYSWLGDQMAATREDAFA
jgi:hydrogenase nickel incorporation protein HypB